MVSSPVVRWFAAGTMCVTILSDAALVEASLTTLYVDSDAPAGGDGRSWLAPFTDLQLALNAASVPGSGVTEIRVGAGVYVPSAMTQPPNVRTATFKLISGIVLRGGYAGFGGDDPDVQDPFQFASVLSADIPGANCYHVITGFGISVDTIVDGFVITGASASGSCCTHDRGGGILLYDCNILFSRCVITANSASNVAAGMWSSDGTVRMVGCTFQDNTVSPANSGGAIHNVFGSDLTLVRCTFINNRVLGFTGGGAIFNGGIPASQIQAIGCTFQNNRSGGSGGAIYNAGYANLSNCVFTANKALAGLSTNPPNGRGGAVANYGQMRISNCTFYANSSLYGGGGVFSQGADINTELETVLHVDNCIFRENTGGKTVESQQLAWLQHVFVYVRYCCIQGLSELAGQGNIGEDPILVDPVGSDGIIGTSDDNLRLTAASPCIDSGFNNGVPDDLADLNDNGETSEFLPTDFDGLPRFADALATPDTGCGVAAIVDIGPFEFRGTAALPIRGDTTGDGILGMDDLIETVAEWGGCNGCCLADFDANGMVNLSDLLYLIFHWNR